MSGRIGRAIERRLPPMAALAVAVLAVSTSAILIRYSEAPSTIKALYRVVFTTLLVAPVALGRIATSPDHRAALARLAPRDVLGALVAGVALAVHFAAWFESLEWTSVAASVTLVQTQPLFVAVGAALVLDERVTRTTVAGIVVAVVGAAVMSVAEPSASSVADWPLLGNALAVLGAVMAAGYVLAGRSIRQRVSLFVYVTIVYAACAVVLLVLAVGQGIALVGYPPREWLLFLAMAVGPGLFGHTVVNWALEHVESSVVSVTLLGEPVGSTLLAVVLLSEIPGATTVLGGAVVLAGIYVTTRSRADGSDASDDHGTDDHEGDSETGPPVD